MALSTEQPTLRRDAARNRDKIVAAAREAFADHGVDVGVDVIANQAGVGVGTLYRRFPTKESLIDAIIDELFEQVSGLAHDSLDAEPPELGFAGYLRGVGQLQVDHIGCLSRLWNHTGHAEEIEIHQLLGCQSNSRDSHHSTAGGLPFSSSARIFACFA